MQKGAEIHYLTKKPFVAIVEANPYVSKVYTISKKVSEVNATLRNEKYDFIIDLHHNLRSFLVKWSMPFVKSYSFKKLNFQKWLLVNFKINRLPDEHIVDRYLDTVKGLGVKNDGKGLDFFLNDEVTINQFLSLEGRDTFFGEEKEKEKMGKKKQYIALPIGAGRNTKALTIEKIVEVCQSINYPFVLLGGKQELEKAQRIEQLLGRFSPPDPLQRGKASWGSESLLGSRNLKSLEKKTKNKVINLVGKCSLIESAAIVKNASVVLTGDTGLMHIAAAFRKPIVSIWGNTVPEFGMVPYYPKGMDVNTIIEVKNLPCRPCSKIGYTDCPKGHFKCIEQLSVNEILTQLKEFTATP